MENLFIMDNFFTDNPFWNKNEGDTKETTETE